MNSFLSIHIPSQDDEDENCEKTRELFEELKTFKLLPVIRQLNTRIFQSFVIICYKHNNHIFLHLLQKKICSLNGNDPNYTNHVNYLATIALVDTLEIPTIYHRKITNYDSYKVKYSDSNEYNINPEEKINLDIDYYFENFFVNLHDLDNIENLVFDFNSINEFYPRLRNVRSGLWFGYNDARWQIMLASLMFTYYPESLGNPFSVNNKYFSYGNKLDFYFPKYNSRSKFSKEYMQELGLTCDICSIKLGDFFYHNDNCGDFCSTCFNRIKDYQKNRIIDLKKKMLLPGKRIVFKRNVEKTKKMLEKIEIQKLSMDNELKFLKSMNKELLKIKHESVMECGICLDTFYNQQISAGTCGHCFHSSCINNKGLSQCPLCRKNTKFIELYL